MITQRRMKHTHTAAVSILVPHSKFTPTPTMSPLTIAYHKGREAKRLGRPAENPHEFLAPNDGSLAAEWDKGYNS